MDFILGDHEVAIEVKGTDNVQLRHLKGLKSFSEEYEAKKLLVVSNAPFEGVLGNVTILPWSFFLQKLWTGYII